MLLEIDHRRKLAYSVLIMYYYQINAKAHKIWLQLNEPYTCYSAPEKKEAYFSKSDFLLQELVASTPEPRNWRANIISVLGTRFNLKMFVSL